MCVVYPFSKIITTASCSRTSSFTRREDIITIIGYCASGVVVHDKNTIPILYSHEKNWPLNSIRMNEKPYTLQQLIRALYTVWNSQLLNGLKLLLLAILTFPVWLIWQFSKEKRNIFVWKAFEFTVCENHNRNYKPEIINKQLSA